jgi:hypothetical protein
MRMRFLVKCLAAATIAMAVIAPAFAQQRLKPIGSAVYDPKPVGLLSYKITVAAEDRFLRSLRVEATRGSGEVRDIILSYRDGAAERVHIHQVLRQGGITAPVRVNPDRPLTSIELTYGPQGAMQFTLLAEGGAPPPPPAPVVEWTELGCKSVGFLIDRDIISVASRDAFKSLRLRSQEFEIEMREMAVLFGNGERDIYRLNLIIPPGGRTAAIDLRGARRYIREIQLTYASRTISNRKTKLCVDGLKYVN